MFKEKRPDDYDRCIKAFYDRILEMLSKPADGSPPKQKSSLYPENAPPDVLIFIGDPDPAQVAAVRNQVPGSTFLFWLYPPCDVSAGEAMESAFAGTRTLFCPVDDKSWCLDKVSILVSVMPNKQVRFIVGQGYGEKYAEFKTKLEKAIRQSIENTMQDLTRGLIRLRCSIHNLPSIVANSDRRPCAVKGRGSAIVCAAGPSLSTQFDLLKEASEKIFIIAVGHAVPSMLKAGIIPDVVAESDSQAFRNWPDDIEKVDSILLANTEVSPEVAERFDRIFWCFGSSLSFNLLMDRWSVRLTDVRYSKTVVVSAIDFAARMGFSNIALVGQDLCVGEAGRQHVDEGAPATDNELFEIPGNEGQTVLTTADLSVLRDSLQDYVKAIAEAPEHMRPRIVNCTHRGALIEGTEREFLQDFLSTASSVGTGETDLIESAGRIVGMNARLKRLFQEWDTYRRVSADTVDCCGKLKHELRQSDPKMPRVKKLQQQLQELMQEEIRVRSGEDIGLLLNPMVQYVDSILNETPGMVSQDPDPFVQLTFLEHRFGFVRDLCSDIGSDFQQAIVALEKGGDAPPTTDSYVFSSFRKQAMGLVRQHNPEFASALSTWSDTEYEDGFKIAWINQMLPFVEKILPDGSRKPLSTFLTSHSEAGDALREFFGPDGFQKERHALVFVAPGNYTHPYVFAKSYPDAEMMIVDPWPELFSAMISRGCFLHRMPRNTLVVGAHPKINRWKSVFKNRIDEWRRDRREILFFIPPIVEDLEEVLELKEQIDELIL